MQLRQTFGRSTLIFSDDMDAPFGTAGIAITAINANMLKRQPSKNQPKPERPFDAPMMPHKKPIPSHKIASSTIAA
jgi:hypothetical protein